MDITGFVFTISFYALFVHINVEAVPLIFRSLNATSNLETSVEVNCPCPNPVWCNLVPDTSRKEVFAFSVKNDSTHWLKFDWKKLTTVVMVGYYSKDLMCLAHSLNTKVSYIPKIDFDFRNSSLRKQWIQKQLHFIQSKFLDGINFDYEELIKESDNKTRSAYTSLVAETNNALKKVLPFSQVTVDVAWKANIDQRFYDYKGLAASSDFLFVMAYDEQSQIFGECVAMPNSGFDKALIGVGLYISEGIPQHQLVLGLPWYGYIYPCQQLDGDTCHLKRVPFRGAQCSDAAGKQYDYSYIRKLTSSHTVKWNQTASSPYFSFNNPDDKVDYQIQYDNPESLSKKYDLALKMNLRGVGMWNIDSLDFSDTPDGLACRSEMFDALPKF